MEEVVKLLPGPGAVIFRRCRLRMGWTMKQVGEKLGVTSAAVSSWELGSSWPKDKSLDSLCVLYGLLYEEILDLKPDGPTLLAMKLQRGRKRRGKGLRGIGAVRYRAANE